MSVTMLPPRSSTTGTMNFWDGTKDNQEGYMDYASGQSNVNPPKEVHVNLDNIRHLDQKPSFAEVGYELRKIPSSLTADELYAGDTPEGKARIRDALFAETTEIVKQVVGSEPKIIPSYFKVRQGRGNDASHLGIDKHRHAIRPLAHVDRDPSTIYISVRDAVGAEEAEILMRKYKRWAQVNVWRPIGNIASKWPLAMMNHQQIPEWEYDTHFGRVGSRNDPRNVERGEKAHDLIAKEDSRYKYYYASDMTPDEVWVFCSFDTDRNTVVPHGAFWDDNTPEDAPERASIEVRHVVFFDEREN